jgi:hypothetical protein
MTFTAITRFSFDDPIPNNARFEHFILFTLTERKIITEFIDSLVKNMNDDFEEKYPGNGCIITYTYIGSELTFIANNDVNALNPRVEFRYNAIKY